MDKYDIPFLFKSINDEMPLFSKNSAKVKCSYSQGMPKNFKEYGDKVNEKFLDNSLATIEDYSLKFPDNELTQGFKDYQNRYFNSVLLKDSFLKIDEDGDFGTIRNYRGTSIQNAGFLGSLTNKVNGAELSTYNADTTHNAHGHLNVRAAKLPAGIVGQYYDRVKIKLFSASGNYKMAAYDESGGIPNSLYQQTGSLTTANDNWETLTEFALTQTTVWAADIGDTPGGVNAYYVDGTGNRSSHNATTFGAQFWNPWQRISEDAYPDQMKLGHS